LCKINGIQYIQIGSDIWRSIDYHTGTNWEIIGCVSLRAPVWFPDWTISRNGNLIKLRLGHCVERGEKKWTWSVSSMHRTLFSSFLSYRPVRCISQLFFSPWFSLSLFPDSLYIFPWSLFSNFIFEVKAIERCCTVDLFLFIRKFIFNRVRQLFFFFTIFDYLDKK